MIEPVVSAKKSAQRDRVLPLIVLSLVWVGTAFARDYSSGPGLSIGIPDDAYDGTTSSMASATIAVPADHRFVVCAVAVEVAMTHGWIGDLVIKLRSPSGEIVTLMHRPGLTGVADDGRGCCGYDANFNATFPIWFDDAAVSGVLAENMGFGLPGTWAVGDPANGSADNYVPDAGDLGLSAGGPLTDELGALEGETAAGDWMLLLGDCALSFSGSLDRWRLRLLGPRLIDSEPSADGTLPKVSDNVIFLVFSNVVELPPGAALSIVPVGGGPDIGEQMEYVLRDDNVTLEARDPFGALADQTWYRIAPTPDFDVQPFALDLQVLEGDVDGDGVVTEADYFALKTHMGDRNGGRWDLNGSGRVTTADYIVIKYRLGNRSSLKPLQ